MMKWWKARSRQEKWMIVIIVMLLVGIILRWDFIRKEAGDAFRWRMDRTKTEQSPAPLADSIRSPVNN